MDWLYEAAAETYIPLLQEFNSLVEDGISPNVTIGITPILAEQLSSEKFKGGFINYLDQKIDAAIENRKEFAELGNRNLEYLAGMWEEYYNKIKEIFSSTYSRDIINEYKKLQDNGHIEIITCAATHGYLPLLGTEESVDAQIRVGKEAYKHHFGRDPIGIWLPECAYRPSYEWSFPISNYPKKFHRKGIEEFLFKYDIQYFIVDKSLIMGGESRGVYIDRFDSLKQLWRQFEKNWKPLEIGDERSIYENYLVSSTGTSKAAVVYGRHEDSALQVWSGEWGYPGDGRYLEFHKKHYPGGHRYWKVTDSKADLADKMEYYPSDVEDALNSQSDHFVGILHNFSNEYYSNANKPGIITAPFDTELFGHWWFEGPRWLSKVIRKANNSSEIKAIKLSEHLASNRPKKVISLPEGSWGQGGFHYIWLNEWTEWTWKHIYASENKMVDLADKYKNTADKTIERILNQMARELLLLESSDWQFLISTWSARDYAENRVVVHNEHIYKLEKILFSYEINGKINDSEEKVLNSFENTDSVFPNIDFRYWRRLKDN
jgi:1,4-alpha-glucan branching enzyme